jgi:uncharacterized protein involved in type VI secretion and phage assembly
MRPGGPRIDSMDEVQYGLHYAVVCEKLDPDGLERVKVRLPWLDRGDTDETHWAQLLTPMEGKGFGWYTRPDKDDVVLVMFIGGEISQPVIVGGVWSTTDFSPEPNEDGKNNFRGYRSRAGHRLILDDSSKVKVVFADKTTTNMVGLGEFDQDGKGPNVCAIFKPPMAGTTGVSFSSMEGQLELTCKGGKLAITAGKDIKINAKTTIDIKAGGALTVEGNTTKLSSTGPSSYDASKTDLG